jgi:hypothetical protein
MSNRQILKVIAICQIIQTALFLLVIINYAMGK